MELYVKTREEWHNWLEENHCRKGNRWSKLNIKRAQNLKEPKPGKPESFKLLKDQQGTCGLG